MPMNGPPLFFDDEADARRDAGGAAPVVASPVAARPAAALAGQAAVTPSGVVATRTKRAEELRLPPAGVRLRPEQKILDRRGLPLRYLLLGFVVIALLVAAFLAFHGRPS